MKTKVVLVDDHASVRQMLGVVLLRDGGYEVAGEAGTGIEGLAACRRLKPRLLIIDLMLPEMSGLEVIRRLRDELSETRLLVYSGTLNAELIVETMQARPHGFVHKQDSLETLREALRAVNAGCSFFTPFATDLLGRVRGEARHSWPALSARERTVLQMVAEGMSSKQMAGRLAISTKTVEHYRAQVMQKLDVHDVAGLTRWAVRKGLVSLD